MSEATVTRWWWVRHAPVVPAHRGRIYGQSDVPAVTDDRPAFESLASTLPNGAVWVTTHLGRTHQTAAAIVDAGHTAAEPAIEPELAEQHFGEWQGLDYAELERAKAGVGHPFWVAPAHFAAPGGETFVDVMERVTRCVMRLSQHHAGRDIVAVAHGGSIRAALGHALDLDPERALAFTIDNLSITRIEHVANSDGPAAWRVATVNMPPGSAR